MKVLIEMPEELLKQIEERSRLLGKDLNGLVIEYLSNQFDVPSQSDTAKGHGRPFPVKVSVGGGAVPGMTNRELEEVLVREDIEKYNRPT